MYCVQKTSMTDQDRIETAVVRAVEILNQTLSSDEQVDLEPQTSLIELNSLAITNLLVAVEEAVREYLGVDISMTDDRTLDLLMSPEHTPLLSVRTLIDYVGGLVNEVAP